MTEPATDRPFEIRHIDHVVLRTSRVAELRAFYETIGCELVKEAPEIGLSHLRAGSTMIDLVDVDGYLGRKGGPAPEPDGHNVDHVALRIEPFDRDTLHRFLDDAGIEWADPPGDLYGAEGPGPAIYLTDPDGNGVELKGPPALSPPPPD